MPVLQTRHLTLTPCRPEDRDDFIALEQDPAVMRFLNGGHPVGRAEADPDADFLMPRGSEPHVWTARHTADSGFVGWFCLWPDGDGSAELGYRLRRAEWGKGLASEGASALMRWGFETALYDRITATTMAVNSASRRVMEKIGLRFSRTVHAVYADPIPGAEQGDVWYEVKRSEWRGA